jgi:energy-coupling factor transporter transmembrane protein EcfT
MLVGDEKPATLAGRMCEYVIVFVFLIPWFLMGAGSLLVGLLALGPRRADLAELWICLPAGLALLLLVGVVLYIHFWRTPRLTISHFEFDGSTLKCVTPGNGALSHAVSELRSVVEERGRLGRGLLGVVVEVRKRSMGLPQSVHPER